MSHVLRVCLAGNIEAVVTRKDAKPHARL